MGIPRHNLFKKLREQRQDIVKRFCSDLEKVEVTENTRVVITIDGESLKYSIKDGESTIESFVTTCNRETFFDLVETAHNDFEKIEVQMYAHKII